MGCPRCREEFMLDPVENSYSKTWIHDMLFYICKRCGCEFAVKDNTPGYRSTREALNKPVEEE